MYRENTFSKDVLDSIDADERYTDAAIIGEDVDPFVPQSISMDGVVSELQSPDELLPNIILTFIKKSKLKWPYNY